MFLAPIFTGSVVITINPQDRGFLIIIFEGILYLLFDYHCC